MSGRSYAVWWEEGASPRHAGRLQLGRFHLLLCGNGFDGLAVPLDEITSVEYRRGVLEIARIARPELRIGNLDGLGVLLELGDALAEAA